eukprot:3611612-Rhodomonas_salina.2
MEALPRSHKQEHGPRVQSGAGGTCSAFVGKVAAHVEERRECQRVSNHPCARGCTPWSGCGNGVHAVWGGGEWGRETVCREAADMGVGKKRKEGAAGGERREGAGER